MVDERLAAAAGRLNAWVNEWMDGWMVLGRNELTSLQECSNDDDSNSMIINFCAVVVLCARWLIWRN